MSTPMPLTTAMTYQDLAGYIEDHGPVEVVFHEGVENLESYPEAGIRGRIVGIRYDNHGQEEKPEDQVLKVQIHYDGYEVQNSLFESSNYVDRMSRFRLRAAPSRPRANRGGSARRGIVVAPMKKGSTGAFLPIKQQEPSRRRLHRQLQWALVFTRPRHRNFAFGFRNVARVLASNALALDMHILGNGQGFFHALVEHPNQNDRYQLKRCKVIVVQNNVELARRLDGLFFAFTV